MVNYNNTDKLLLADFVSCRQVCVLFYYSDKKIDIWQPWCRWEGPVPPHTSTHHSTLNHKLRLDNKQIQDLCKSSQLVIRYLPLNYPQEDYLKMIQEQGEVVKWEQELQVRS